MTRLLPVVLTTAGAVLIVAGLAAWSLPLAAVVAGAGLVVVGVFYRFEQE